MKTLREMMDLIESAQQGVAEGTEQKFKVAVDCEDDGVFTVVVTAGDEREARKKAWKIVQREHETWPVSAKIVGQGVAEAKSDDPDYDESLKRFKKGLPPKKKSVAEEQVEESTPDALAKIEDLFRK